MGRLGNLVIPREFGFESVGKIMEGHQVQEVSKAEQYNRLAISVSQIANSYSFIMVLVLNFLVTLY